MRVEREPACVLHTRPWRETSLLLEVLTPGHGRVGLIQRAARGGRRAPAARPFRLLRMDWRGRGDLPTVTQAELLEPFPGLTGLAAVCGLYVNELTLRLLPRGLPVPELFPVYCRSLTELGHGAPPDVVLRRYELHLLRALGYAPVLERDARGRAVSARGRYRYDRERGLVPVPAGGGGPLISGDTALALANGRLGNAAQRREARDLLRHLLDPLLGERPLHSRALLHRLQAARRNESS